MADSIAEKILANILTTLQGITAANGYVNTLKTVERDPLAALDIQYYPAAFIMSGSDVPERGAYDISRRTLNLSIEGWVRQEKNLSKAVESLKADIQKAMMVDPHRGANATDTVEGHTTYLLLMGESPEAGFQIGYAVNYRTKADDPFTAV